MLETRSNVIKTKAKRRQTGRNFWASHGWEQASLKAGLEITTLIFWSLTEEV